MNVPTHHEYTSEMDEKSKPLIKVLEFPPLRKERAGMGHPLTVRYVRKSKPITTWVTRPKWFYGFLYSEKKM